MAKRKAREQTGEAPTLDNIGEFPPSDTPSPTLETTVGNDPRGVCSEGPGADGTGAPEGKWSSTLPEPFGRHSVALGDGRTIRLARSNRWQQAQISITAPEGMDPRPSAEDKQFLKDNGFRWRAGDVQAWTRQLVSPDDKEAIAAIEADQGEIAASMERSKRRANNDADIHAAFVTLANAIRARNGKEPISIVATQDIQR